MFARPMPNPPPYTIEIRDRCEELVYTDPDVKIEMTLGPYAKGRVSCDASAWRVRTGTLTLQKRKQIIRILSAYLLSPSGFNKDLFFIIEESDPDRPQSNNSSPNSNKQATP